MSILDKIIDDLTPDETEEDRTRARAAALALTTPGDWLSAIVAHHVEIEQAFADLRNMKDADARKAALKALALILTGHAIAEEAVVYPAMMEIGEKGQAGLGYNEQATVKSEMASLEKLLPMNKQFDEKLASLEKTVRHHMFKEEASWLPKLKDALPAADQYMLGSRYTEEYQRYVGPQF